MTQQINAELALELHELLTRKEAYYKHVIRIKIGNDHDEHLVEDIFERAYMDALNGINTFEGRNNAKLSTWVTKVVKNACSGFGRSAEGQAYRDASLRLDGLMNDDGGQLDAGAVLHNETKTTVARVMTPEEACEANEFYTVIVASFIKACTSRLSAGEQKLLRATEGIDELTQMSAERKLDLAAEIGATYEVVRGYITSIPRKLSVVIAEYRERGYFADSSDARKALQAFNVAVAG